MGCRPWGHTELDTTEATAAAAAAELSPLLDRELLTITRIPLDKVPGNLSRKSYAMDK